MLHAVTIEAEVMMTKIYTAYVDDHDQPMSRKAIEEEARRIANESPEDLTDMLEQDESIVSITSVEYAGIVKTE